MTERAMSVALGLQSAAIERTAAWEKLWRAGTCAGTISGGCMASRAQAEAADTARAERRHLPDEVGQFWFRNPADPEGSAEPGPEKRSAGLTDATYTKAASALVERHEPRAASSRC